MMRGRSRRAPVRAAVYKAVARETIAPTATEGLQLSDSILDAVSDLLLEAIREEDDERAQLEGGRAA